MYILSMVELDIRKVSILVRRPYFRGEIACKKQFLVKEKGVLIKEISSF